MNYKSYPIYSLYNQLMLTEPNIAVDCILLRFQTKDLFPILTSAEVFASFITVVTLYTNQI